MVAEATSDSLSGPVSQVLEAELRELARQHGIIVWLDREGSYSAFAAQLAEKAHAGTFPFPVIPFDGSFLSLMFALEPLERDATMTPMVLHMPGFTEEGIASTPAYELYCAGRRHRRALVSLTRDAAEGRVAPTAIAEMQARGVGDLAEADAWLAGQLSGVTAPTLPSLPVLAAEALYDDLSRKGPVAQQIADPRMSAVVFDHLERSLGLSAEFVATVAQVAQVAAAAPSGQGDASREQPLPAREWAHVMASWALSVEFVHDLSRPPLDDLLIPLSALTPGLVKASCALAKHLRMQHPEAYRSEADNLESALMRETAQATASDLGRVDTFRFEDRKVFEASLQALREQRWAAAAEFGARRTPENSFWVRHDSARRAAWDLVRKAADMGLAIEEQAKMLASATSVHEASQRYAQGGYRVDLAQRKLEQARNSMSLLRGSHAQALREGLDEARRAYRSWADDQARRFNALCRQHGFLPTEGHQRTLFDEVVRPAADERLTAYFMVDALRYEMAAQLQASLSLETDARTQLAPRLAELPTVTEVGMNALAPVARNGRLAPDVQGSVIGGMRVGESRVKDPESRRKAIHERVGGEACPLLSLEELLERDVTSLRKAVARARLIVVHSDGIDKCGEKGTALQQFEHELQQLRAAVQRLREVGVRSFVITADHGFLLQDATTRAPLPHGRKTDPKRRHLLDRVGADRPGEACVSARALGYEGEDVHFIFPETTQPFDTGKKTKVFLHGGNSLQERVIPVLSVRYKHAAGSLATTYQLEANAERGVLGAHRISARAFQAAQTTLGFGGAPTLELRLAVVDAEGVSVELLDAPGARMDAGAVVATVNEPFEVLFRLSAAQAMRVKVRLEHATGAEDVEARELDSRFAVDVVEVIDDDAHDDAPVAAPAPLTTDWLEELPEGPVREVFRHIQNHGAINEAEAIAMLGGPRKLRHFSKDFETYAQRAPFAVHLDMVNGQKRYVREG